MTMTEFDLNSEISRLRLFIKCIDFALTFPKNVKTKDVSKEDLLDLLRIVGFSYDEAVHYMENALDNGQIYEKSKGVVTKT